MDATGFALFDTALAGRSSALDKNPVPIIAPCHRILAANGKTGGFSVHAASPRRAP